MTNLGDARDWTGPEGDDELVAAHERPGEARPSVSDVEALAALRVLSGTPDEDELAALLAGLATARALARTEGAPGSGEADGPERGPSGAGSAWTDHAHRLGVRSVGAGAWRWSAQR
ncbi:acyl-CoA carboxylase epsilon subunit [Georgenia sp. Z1491]|uniref:acyl-CoA carboxylase epsilon subunit n=1 Tax=Georgenia sp. Z1491 TaxID=3416707 RepID=UPI003CE80934